MPSPQELTGIPTKKKANQIARQIRQLNPGWAVKVIGTKPPYTVKATPSIPPAPSSKPLTPPPTSTKKNSVPPARTSPPKSSKTLNRAGIIGFLDFIAKYESTGNYNAYYGAVTNTNNPSLISMTIKEILAWQSGRKFSACGKYQIIRQTLTGLTKELKLSGNELFNASLQDKLAKKLLKRRGIDSYLSNKISKEEFAFKVAHEWAALPRVKKPFGERSVYAGDGINQALVTVPVYLAAIDKLKNTS